MFFKKYGDQAPVAYACNTRYLGDQENVGLKPA
jgi:hypothetical protein